jgi:hypothetical protein
MSERKLLNEDGIDMSEDTWLELTLAFVTNGEKQTLQVPALDRRAELEHGYGVPQLQQALAQFDPSTFKPFRQANCKDPVALRVIEIDRVMNADKKKSSAPAPPKKEVHAIGKANEKKAASLPIKDGSPDQSVYDKFATDSLRRRVWDAITASKCPRCNGDHLRNACSKPRQAWEDDFEKSDFFTKPFVKTAQKSKTARVQWLAPPDLNAPGALWVTCGIGRCIPDTGSDVSLALRERLSHNCLSPSTVEVSHLGGCTTLQEMVTLHLDDPLLGRPSPGIDGVFAVDSSALPGDVAALLGVPDIRRLALSLDYVLTHPGCDWQSARPSSCLDVCLRMVGVRRYRPPFVTAVFPPIPEQLENNLVASLPGGRPVDPVERSHLEAKLRRTRRTLERFFAQPRPSPEARRFLAPRYLVPSCSPPFRPALKSGSGLAGESGSSGILPSALLLLSYSSRKSACTITEVSGMQCGEEDTVGYFRLGPSVSRRLRDSRAHSTRLSGI